MNTERVEERGEPKLQSDVYAIRCSVVDDDSVVYDWNQEDSESQYTAMSADEVNAWIGAQEDQAKALLEPIPEAPEGVPLLYEGDTFTLSQGEAAWIPTVAPLEMTREILGEPQE